MSQLPPEALKPAHKLSHTGSFFKMTNFLIKTTGARERIKEFREKIRERKKQKKKGKSPDYSQDNNLKTKILPD